MTGWIESGGAWYYLSPDNAEMLIGTHTIDGQSYTFAESGAVLTGMP